MAKHTKLCDAVKDHLNGESLSISFTATRVNCPIDQMKDAGQLAVVVFPGPRASTGRTRGGTEKTFVVSVLIIEKLDEETTAARMAREDKLIGLAEEVEESLEMVGFTLGDGTTMAFLEQESEGSGVDPIEIAEASFGVFATVVSVVFQKTT